MILPVQHSNNSQNCIVQVVYSRTLAGIYCKLRIRIGFANLLDIQKKSAQNGV